MRYTDEEIIAYATPRRIDIGLTSEPDGWLRRFGPMIKKMYGSYSERRGSSTRRVVSVGDAKGADAVLSSGVVAYNVIVRWHGSGRSVVFPGCDLTGKSFNDIWHKHVLSQRRHMERELDDQVRAHEAEVMRPWSSALMTIRSLEKSMGLLGLDAARARELTDVVLEDYAAKHGKPFPIDQLK